MRTPASRAWSMMAAVHHHPQGPSWIDDQSCWQGRDVTAAGRDLVEVGDEGRSQGAFHPFVFTPDAVLTPVYGTLHHVGKALLIVEEKGCTSSGNGVYPFCSPPAIAMKRMPASWRTLNVGLSKSPGGGHRGSSCRRARCRVFPGKWYLALSTSTLINSIGSSLP